MIKYHLGCGSFYLDGYVNVDFPPSEHTVNNVKADMYANLIDLKYECCDEIRCHHVFEHFNYPDSFYLLRQWTNSLNINGLLWIDIPNVLALAQALCEPGSIERDFKIIRYLYGSHEASWAYHINGWTPRMLTHVLSNLGYTSKEINIYGDIRTSLPNCGFSIKATLTSKYSIEKIDTILKEIFTYYMNGTTDFEQKLCSHLSQTYEARCSS